MRLPAFILVLLLAACATEPEKAPPQLIPEPTVEAAAKKMRENPGDLAARALVGSWRSTRR